MQSSIINSAPLAKPEGAKALKILDGMERLKRNSRRLRRVLLFFMVLIPVITALFWLDVALGDPEHRRRLPVPVDANLPVSSVMAGFTVSLIPTLFVMYALYQMIKLLGYYAKGKVFAKKNVACFRALGWSIIAWETANFLRNIALSAILTAHMGPGKNKVIIDFTTYDFNTLLAGFCVLTIAWVMDEARKLKEEHELFV